MNAAQMVARAPLRTVRAGDLGELYAFPRQEVRALERRGVLHRLAHGIYCAVPAEHDPGLWRPGTEAATAAIATVLYGDRVPVLMGLSAARVHHGLPRAVALGHVAVPSPRRPLAFLDRPGEVRFSARRVGVLDAVLVQTELGPALATTPEQTVLDLARADPKDVDPDSVEAIASLLPRCVDAVLERIAREQRMRATLQRLWSGR